MVHRRNGHFQKISEMHLPSLAFCEFHLKSDNKGLKMKFFLGIQPIKSFNSKILEIKSTHFLLNYNAKHVLVQRHGIK